MDRAIRSPNGDVEAGYDAAHAVLTCRFSGEIDVNGLARARALSLEVAGDCDVAGMLIDVRRSRPGYRPDDFIESAEEFLTVFAPRRCAFVAGEDPERVRQAALLETIGVANAMRVRAFSDVDTARAWLCEL